MAATLVIQEGLALRREELLHLDEVGLIREATDLDAAVYHFVFDLRRLRMEHGGTAEERLSALRESRDLLCRITTTLTDRLTDEPLLPQGRSR